MKKKFFSLLAILVLVFACATTSLACTPRLTAPKLPKIPTIKVTLSDGVKQSISNYVKNLNLDFKF